MGLHVFGGGSAYDLLVGAGKLITGKDTDTGCNGPQCRSRLGIHDRVISLLKNDTGGVEGIHLPVFLNLIPTTLLVSYCSIIFPACGLELNCHRLSSNCLLAFCSMALWVFRMVFMLWRISPPVIVSEHCFVASAISRCMILSISGSSRIPAYPGTNP
jgi:hypothetical protein